MGHYAVFMCRSVGSLINDYGDGNENGRKAMELDWQSKNFACIPHAFLYIY